MTHLLLMLATALAQPNCEPLSGEWILAADLSRLNPVFAALPPETRIGKAPMAGARRVFSTEELVRLARRYQLPVMKLRPMCIAWASEPLSPEKLITAMAQVLDVEKVAVEIEDYNRTPVPDGMLVFVKENLRPVAGSKDGLFLWKGVMRYAENRSMPVWAKVHIAGIEQNFRPQPPDVKAGDVVQLEVHRGPLTIRTEARAEQTGRAGDLIPLTNLASGARLMARIEEKGKLSITVP